MFLLVGLGNIGKDYEQTRHNIGFMMIDYLADIYSCENFTAKMDNQISSGLIHGEKVLLAKPQKYMNLSGGPVQKLMSFYKITPEKVIVFHDEIDLKLGKIKVKIGGGSAGHNGLKDIDRVIGPDYQRVRLGVGRPEDKNYPVADFVLSKWSESEDLEKVQTMLKKTALFVPLLLQGQIEEFATKINN